MNKHTTFRKRHFISLLLIALMMVLSYAFAAANVVPESGAGDGAGAISGYTVTNVQYVLEAGNPANLSTVSFNIAPTAGAGAVSEVQVQLFAAGPWYGCDETAAPAVTCNIAGETVGSATQLRVVATD